MASKVVLLGGSNSTSPWPKDPEILAKIEELSLPVQALETKTVGELISGLTVPIVAVLVLFYS